MGTPAVLNVLKTGAVLWKAPVGEAKPDETSVVFGAALGGNWERVGYTVAPLALKVESEEYDVEVEEVLAAINRFRTAESLEVETTLGELTMEYLMLATGDPDTVSSTAAGAAQKAFESAGIGDNVDLTQYAWCFEGRYITAGGDDEPVRFFIHKGTARLNGPIEFSKKADSQPGLVLQIKALADMTQSEGQRLAWAYRVTSEVT